MKLSMGAVLVAIMMALVMLAPAVAAADGEDNDGGHHAGAGHKKAEAFKGWTKPDRPTYICQLQPTGDLRCQEMSQEQVRTGQALLSECVVRTLAIAGPAAALTCFIPKYGLGVFTITPEQQIPG